MAGGYGDTAAFMNFIGGLISSAAQREAGQQVQKYYEAKQVEANQDAESTERWARYNENQQRRTDKLKRSKMSVRYIKSGVTTDQGTTAALVLEEQEIQDEMTALSIRAKGISDAARLRSRSSHFRVAGRNALASSKTAAWGTLFASAATSATLADGPGSASGGDGGQKSSGAKAINEGEK
jgi:hypothetical protein